MAKVVVEVIKGMVVAVESDDVHIELAVVDRDCEGGATIFKWPETQEGNLFKEAFEKR